MKVSNTHLSKRHRIQLQRINDVFLSQPKRRMKNKYRGRMEKRAEPRAAAPPGAMEVSPGLRGSGCCCLQNSHLSDKAISEWRSVLLGLLLILASLTGPHNKTPAFLHPRGGVTVPQCRCAPSAVIRVLPGEVQKNFSFQG